MSSKKLGDGAELSHDTSLHASSKAAQMRAVKSSKAGTQEREGNLGDGTEVSHDTRLHASLLQREVDALPPAMCAVISVVI